MLAGGLFVPASLCGICNSPAFPMQNYSFFPLQKTAKHNEERAVTSSFFFLREMGRFLAGTALFVAAYSSAVPAGFWRGGDVLTAG
jgi:hypothetical protein